ncbi:MAG: ABC transporter ATP-binding protein [Cyanobacteria bacterium P01_D01_bin.105]
MMIDDSRWPLVRAHFQGNGTPAEMARFYRCFEGWLARKETFALVMQRDNAEAAEAAGKGSPEAKHMRKDGIAWTKAHKPEISQYCAGVAIVPDSAKLVKLWGPMVAKVTQHMYGCPGKVFGSVESAERWATQKLELPTAVSDAPARLSEVVRRRQVNLALSALLAAVGAALGLVPYYLIYLVSLRLFNPADALTTEYMLSLAGVAIGAVVGKAVCSGISTHLSHMAAFNILYDLRIELARQLGRLPLGYFGERTTGEIKKILHEDVEQLEQGLAHLIPDVVAGVTVPLLAGILLFLVDWRMTLATLASAAIAIGLFALMMARFDMSAYNTLLAKMNGVVIQYINGMKVIKAFTRTDFSFAQLQDVVEEMRQVYVRTTRTSALPMAVMLTLMRSAAITVVPVGIALYLSGSLSVSTFVLFVVMGIGFNRPIMAVLFHGMTGVYQINAASKRIAAVFDQPALTNPAAVKQPASNEVTFKSVSFSYGERSVLNQISFTAPAGGVTALVGPSGAGKSTIAKLIPRFWDVEEGEISIGGVKLQEMAVEQLMERVSFVFQDVFLFNDTVLENIRIGQPTASKAAVIRAAKAARCHDFIKALPQGYDTPIGENGISLSGGQRQRLSIARALLKDAPIVVLDEATAYVDPENEAKVQEAIAALLSNHTAGGEKTLIVVAHRLSTITGADQILVISQGEIVARGRHEELLETCELYQEQWAAHVAAKDWALEESGSRGEGETHFTTNGQYGGQYGADSLERAGLSSISQVGADAPLENPYRALNEDDAVWTMMRKLVPSGSAHYLWRAVRWRLLEGMAIGWTSYLVYLVLVALFQQEDSGVVAGGAEIGGLLWGCVGAIALLCLAQIGFGYRANVQAYALTIAVQTRLRLFIADYLRRLPLGFFTQRSVGTVDALFTTNIMYVEPHHLLESLINAVVTPALIFLVMLVLDWRLALVLASSVPLALLALRYAEGIFARVWRLQAAARVAANARMVEYIQGISVIRAFNLAGDRLHQFRQDLQGYRNASLHTATQLTPAMVIFLAVLELGFALLLVVGAWLFSQGSLSGERFLLFMVLGLAFYTPLMALADMLEFYRIMQNCVRNLNEFLQADLLPVAQSPQVPQDTTIEFKEVSFCYNRETVLKEVSFVIPPRSMTALVGPSGSGKTTITNLIARFWDVTEGSVSLGGVDVRQLTTDTLLSQMTMVFQDVYLFNDTIFENIRFGRPEATESEVIAAARAAQCHGFITAFEQGYQTMVGEGGATLSGGEKQRISIARAMLKDAPIVLLDEATASVDPENERLIQQAIHALSAQKTLIVIAHRLTTIAAADQILVLDQGRIVERGRHESLVNGGGLYQQLWDVKARSHGWKIGSLTGSGRTHELQASHSGAQL